MKCVDDYMYISILASTLRVSHLVHGHIERVLC